MDINQWLHRVDTDDGCSVSQCLKCDSQWESRTPCQTPNRPEGFKCCPYCGTKWDGRYKKTYHRYKQIFETNEWGYSTEFEDLRYKISVNNRDNKVTAWWVLQKRDIPGTGIFVLEESQCPWKNQWKIRFGTEIVWRILDLKQKEPLIFERKFPNVNREKVGHEVWQKAFDAMPKEVTEEVRLIKVVDGDSILNHLCELRISSENNQGRKNPFKKG